MVLSRSDVPGSRESGDPVSDRIQAESQDRTGWLRGLATRFLGNLLGTKPPATKASPDVPQPPEETFDPNGPISGKEILAWAKAHGFGEEMTFETAGILIEQGSSTDYVFIILEPNVADVQYCVDGVCHPLSPLEADSSVGEVSVLSDSQTTAQVSLRKPTKVFAIPKEDFKKILEDPLLGERAMTLVRQRLLHTANFHRQIDDFKKEKAIERAGGKGNAEAAFALDVADVMEDMRISPGSPVVREFRLTGIHHETKEVRTLRFTARYVRKDSSHVSLVIRCNQDAAVQIPIEFSQNGKRADTGYVKLQAYSGFGFYSRMLHYALRTVDYVSATVIEENTVNFLEDLSRRELVSHSELAAHSPLVAARKGFISEMPSGLKTHVPLSSHRVDHEMEMILLIAMEVERSIKDNDETYLRKMYDMDRAGVLDSLLGLMEEYRSGNAYGKVDLEVRTLIDRQYERIKELVRTYPLTA